MDKKFYFEKLYPFQDKILTLVKDLNTPFYLTGGTASSRGYLHHRFSDDLDFFVNDSSQFPLWTEQIINGFVHRQGLKTQVLQKDIRFVRLMLSYEEIVLKIDLVNDVPSHHGELRSHVILGSLDSPENILANKITAVIDRREPKDLADIWGFCTKMNLSATEAITNASSKAAGIFPADLARILCLTSEEDWKVIRWIDPPACQTYLAQLEKIGTSLII